MARPGTPGPADRLPIVLAPRLESPVADDEALFGGPLLCEVDDCWLPATRCVCGNGFCQNHPHDPAICK